MTVPKEKKRHLIIMSLLEMLMVGYEGQRNCSVALLILWLRFSQYFNYKLLISAV